MSELREKIKSALTSKYYYHSDESKDEAISAILKAFEEELPLEIDLNSEIDRIEKLTGHRYGENDEKLRLLVKGFNNCLNQIKSKLREGRSK